MPEKGQSRGDGARSNPLDGDTPRDVGVPRLMHHNM
jgi:hypothetical protein